MYILDWNHIQKKWPIFIDIIEVYRIQNLSYLKSYCLPIELLNNLCKIVTAKVNIK